MKFTSTFLCSLACLVATVSAQTVFIGQPPDGEPITAGQPTVVQIDQPNFLSSSEEISVVIGISSCTSSPCLAPKTSLGNILYFGGFKPEVHEPTKPAYQNFTVNVPSNIAKGKAQINVLHFALIGVSHQAFLEGKNVTVEIQ